MKNKLLNFTICQIFVFVMILLSRVKCQEQKLPSVQNVTSFDRSFEKVLSRRKRFLVWRPGSNLLLTASLVKPLVFPKPTGHAVILEWDMYYPLPINWRKPEPPTPKPPPSPSNSGETKDSPDSHDFHDSHNSGEIWMPSGGWSPDSDVIKTLSESDAQSADQKTPQLRRNDWSRNDLLHSPQLPVVTQYRNPLLYTQQWQQSPQRYSYNSKGKVNLSKQYYQQVSKASKSFIDAHKQQSIGHSIQTVDEDHGRTQEESMDDSWEHHYAHRDRRELYHRIETTSPLSSFDVKSCLLRTICEAQHFLHPPGYSLLQDMLRVIFTIPIKDEMVDDYSNAMRANDQDCVRTYNEKCPMSILAFLLRSKN